MASCHSGVIKSCSLVNFRSFARDDGVRLNSFTNISAVVVFVSKLGVSLLMFSEQVLIKNVCEDLCEYDEEKENVHKEMCRLKGVGLCVVVGHTPKLIPAFFQN